MLALRLVALLSNKPKQKLYSPTALSFEPFVSIIIACANEPANLLAKTLDSMSKLKYHAFEVVLIDNNNTNMKNWQKIKEKCSSLGEKFKFIHIDSVKGFKAGALNLALRYLNPKSEILAIVDADYLVDKDFLNKTVGYFNNPKVGIVQAPQDYYDFKNNPGLYCDYLAFFSVFMNQAERFNAVTFTGTMGLIRRSLFDKTLKWNEWCITEDTEAGLFIHSLGYGGVYLDKSFGRGMMPLSYHSLVKQRTRWSYGNTQILKKDLWPILTNRSFNWQQKISFITQLTAWVHFELVIAMIFLASAVRYSLYRGNASVLIGKLSSIALVSSLLVYFLFYLFGLHKRASIFDRIKGLFAHYGLLFSMSYSWIYCLFGGRLGFQVTEKQKIRSNHFHVEGTGKELIIPILFVSGGIIMLAQSQMSLIWFTPILIYIIIEIIGVYYLSKKFKDLDENCPTSSIMENGSTSQVRRVRTYR